MTREIAQQIVQIGTTKKLSVTTAESCTGGMVSASITDIAGSSKIFERGFVTYSNQAKIEMLGVSEQTLNQHGAVSEEIAMDMATGAREKANAFCAIAISGIAGPGGSEFKPEGRVCFAIVTKQSVKTETKEFGAVGRENVRRLACEHALGLLLEALQSG